METKTNKFHLAQEKEILVVPRWEKGLDDGVEEEEERDEKEEEYRG